MSHAEALRSQRKPTKMSMTTIQLRKTLEQAVEQAERAPVSECKLAFLIELRMRLADVTFAKNDLFGSAGRTTEYLDGDLRRWPLNHSRLSIADLPRTIDIYFSNKFRGALQGLSQIVWEAITVRSGDCNACLGEDLVYLWDPKVRIMFQSCECCPELLDIEGNPVSSYGRLSPPTLEQLKDSGCDQNS